MSPRFFGGRRWLANLILGAIFVILLSITGCGSRVSQVTLDGQPIFSANCSSCHTIGGGNLAGPDLKGSTEQYSQEWLVNFINDPELAITTGDPTARRLLQEYNYVVMPNLGLTNDQILAVIGYIKAESALSVRATPATTPGVNLPAGDPENGKALFLGHAHLKNGAPFCIGCHSIDDVGILGGGSLGPNLTNSYNQYGDAGLEGILSNLPFMTMRPIYANNTMTDQEKADLRAFMRSTAGAPQTNKEPLIIGISLAGFLGIMLAIGIIWRKRIRSVRRQLVDRSRGRR